MTARVRALMEGPDAPPRFSLDGNQGYPSIKINDRTQKTFDFGPKYVFVHLTSI